jgi:hypothetical protein
MRRLLSILMVFLAFHAILLTTMPALAQQVVAPGSDVVFLKHGGEIRGTITELRAGDHATVTLANGQIATIKWDEVEHVERNGQEMQLPGAAPAPAPGPLATPTAQPAPTTGPAAKPPAYVGPATMPYNSDYPPPAGYHVEKKLRLGLLITGAILTGLGALFITAIQVSKGSDTGKSIGSIAVGVVFLGPGIPLLLVGALAQKKVLVRDDLGEEAKLKLGPLPPMSVGVQPHGKEGGGSLILSGSF